MLVLMPVWLGVFCSRKNGSITPVPVGCGLFAENIAPFAVPLAGAPPERSITVIGTAFAEAAANTHNPKIPATVFPIVIAFIMMIC